MSDKQRCKFKCWNCQREYSLLREVQGQPKLMVACPFCEAEGVVDLAPYRSPVVEIQQSGEGGITAETLHLPEVLPTAPVPSAEHG